MKKIVLFLLVALLLSGCGGSEKVEAVSTEPPHDYVVGSETIVDFYDIFREIGISNEKVKNVSKIEDWSNGPRYNVETSFANIVVYCNVDGTVETVSAGTDIDLYKRGFETWTIDNFRVDSSVESSLIVVIEDVVKQFLNYPSTADFPLLDWTVGRQFNRYALRSHVEAKNAFGMPEDIPFAAAYWVENDTYKLIYFEMNGSVALNELDDYPLPERKEVQIEGSEEKRIADGEIGAYGKNVQVGSYEYIWYMLPAGKYEATCNSNNGTIFVDKDEIKKNTDGYAETENVATYTASYGETVTIEVGENQHISLVIGSDFTLTEVTN